MPNQTVVVSSYAMHQEKVEEKWKPIPNCPGYHVSDLGRVLSQRTGRPRFLRGSKQTKGHVTIELQQGDNGKRTQPSLHELVAENFIGKRPPGTVIRHLDGNPANNCVANLTYGTVGQNNIDRHEHAGQYTGKRTGKRKGEPYSRDSEPSVRDALIAAIQASKNSQKVEIPMDLAEDIVRALGT